MASKKNDKTSKPKKSGNTYKGIRKPDDPIYDQTTVVIGPAARKPKVTKGLGSTIKKAGPDHPIFRLGHAVGGTYSKRARQTFTREEALKIMAKSGIPMALPDDPIYRRPPSTIYTPPRGAPTKTPLPSSKSAPPKKEDKS